ncbi:DUF2306 domain-containing protein [Glycocaulis abyssi]|uniref:DUF2306 domain-containing protein n=1 Tax=Glycocaulis abyssi TaxID=1433403 RepID=UPI00352B7018
MLVIHILSGSVALLTGLVALGARKGSGPHRGAGNIFTLTMLVMAISGVLIALDIPAALSAAAGTLTAYQVATAWLTVRRRENQAGRAEWAAMAFAIIAAAGCLIFGMMVARGDLTEYAAGAPIPAGTYFFYGGIALLSAVLDWTVIQRGGLAGRQRIARHVWRMGFALFTAASSFFLGQPQVFPEPVRETPFLLAAPVIIIVVLTDFWFVRVLFTRWADRP